MVVSQPRPLRGHWITRKAWQEVWFLPLDQASKARLASRRELSSVITRATIHCRTRAQCKTCRISFSRSSRARNFSCKRSRSTNLSSNWFLRSIMMISSSSTSREELRIMWRTSILAMKILSWLLVRKGHVKLHVSLELTKILEWCPWIDHATPDSSRIFRQLIIVWSLIMRNLWSTLILLIRILLKPIIKHCKAK